VQLEGGFSKKALQISENASREARTAAGWGKIGVGKGSAKEGWEGVRGTVLAGRKKCGQEGHDYRPLGKKKKRRNAGKRTANVARPVHVKKDHFIGKKQNPGQTKSHGKKKRTRGQVKPFNNGPSRPELVGDGKAQPGGKTGVRKRENRLKGKLQTVFTQGWVGTGQRLRKKGQGRPNTFIGFRCR